MSVNKKLTISKTKIAVVIPVYNNEQQINSVIKNIPAFVQHIIVVDDASKDKTIPNIKKIHNLKLHLVRHKRNQGVGGAMLSGYSLALQLGAEIVVKMDGDDQMDPNYLNELVDPIIKGDFDYCKGNRFLHPKDLLSMPGIRRIGNWGLTFLTKLASGYWNIFDPTNGYTAVHHSILNSINPSNISKNFFFETSMLLEMRRIQARVMDVPIPARYADQKSSLSEWQEFIKFPIKLVIGLFKRLYNQYFLYDFNAASLYLVLGIPSLLFGFIWGVIQWVFSSISGKPASTGTVLIAVLPIILGVQFITQAISYDISSLPSKPIHGDYERISIISRSDSLIGYLEKNRLNMMG
jgi:dolichol-phosphate mannosyltransferase